MMEIVFESGAGGEAIIRRFANDSLVSSLLVLHGLHPDDMETRVRQCFGQDAGPCRTGQRVRRRGARAAFSRRLRVRRNGRRIASKRCCAKRFPTSSEVIVQPGTAMNGFVPLLSVNGTASRAG